MGMFFQRIEIGASEAGPLRSLEAMVDTGATYTWIPASVLAEIGVEPQFRRPFILADGREVEYEMAAVYVRVDGRAYATPCIFGGDGTDPLLGVVTLEELGFGVDPINQTLIPVAGRLAALEGP